MDKTLRMCKVIFHDPLFLKKIDENRLLFCCENGVLDLELGIFRDGRPDDYVTLCSNVPYRKFNDEDDEMIEIMEFLKKVFPDEDLLNYFLDHACSCMEGGNVNKTFVVGTGTGDNGKTITFTLLENTFGDYCMKFPRELFVIGKTNSSAGARPELARVRGKRLAVISEIAKTETLNIGILKELTGNDSFFARGLYEKGTEIRPMFTLMLQCNEPPHVPGHDEATWNRIRVLDFKSKFVLPKHRAKYPVPDDPAEQMRMRRFKADLGLAKKLPDMAVALQSLLFERFKDYKKRGLREPQDVVLSTELYRSMNDIYLQFIKERVEMLDYPKNTPEKQKNFLKLQDLHAEFTAWYQENHSAYAKEKFNKITLLHEFSKKFGPSEKVGRIPGWYGYKILDDVDSGTTDDKQKKLGDLLVGKAKAKATEIAIKKFKDITPTKPSSVKQGVPPKPKSTGKKDAPIKPAAKTIIKPKIK
jgi:P4 family phage/plasmid primase-like protien